MTLPISPSVFLDGELVTEAALYIRVWAAINTLYSTLNANSIQRGTVNVNMSGLSVNTATLTFPTPYNNTPQILLTPRYGTSVNYMVGKVSPTASGCTVRVATPSGTGSETAVIDWVAIGN